MQLSEMHGTGRLTFSQTFLRFVSKMFMRSHSNILKDILSKYQRGL